jgi:hypothetical protein
MHAVTVQSMQHMHAATVQRSAELQRHAIARLRLDLHVRNMQWLASRHSEEHLDVATLCCLVPGTLTELRGKSRARVKMSKHQKLKATQLTVLPSDRQHKSPARLS